MFLGACPCLFGAVSQSYLRFSTKQNLTLNFHLKKKICIYFWLHWVFVLHEFSLVEASRGYPLVAMHRLLKAVVSFAAEHRF